MIIRLLHLSDLHFAERNVDVITVGGHEPGNMKKWYALLSWVRRNQNYLDCAIITGDICHSGNDDDLNFGLLQINRLNKLVHVLAMPGNHDYMKATLPISNTFNYIFRNYWSEQATKRRIDYREIYFRDKGRRFRKIGVVFADFTLRKTDIVRYANDPLFLMGGGIASRMVCDEIEETTEKLREANCDNFGRTFSVFWCSHYAVTKDKEIESAPTRLKDGSAYIKLAGKLDIPLILGGHLHKSIVHEYVERVDGGDRKTVHVIGGSAISVRDATANVIELHLEGNKIEKIFIQGLAAVASIHVDGPGPGYTFIESERKQVL